MKTLLDRWQSVGDSGTGEAVLLSGEPGMGKSRIASALLERLGSEGVQSLRFQCSPFYINSAFHPLIANFERTLDFGRDEAPGSRLDKLEALIVGHYRMPAADVRFLAAMLSLPHEERYGPLTMAPRLVKEETIRVLVDIVKAAAQARPCLLLYEDVHWADPTSLEALSVLIDRLDAIPALVVLTHRPEFEPPWQKYACVTTVDLARLPSTQSRRACIEPDRREDAPGRARRPDRHQDRRRAAVHRGADQDHPRVRRPDRTRRSLPLCRPVRQGLDPRDAARLADGASRPCRRRQRIAQVGSVIGREFGYDLVAEIVKMARRRLPTRSSRLVASELASCRGEIPQAVYTFKHALVQDTAYDSLLKSQRMRFTA